ncbi:MAG: methyltransferase domain-containing protein [Gaiellaceae bacterium]
MADSIYDAHRDRYAEELDRAVHFSGKGQDFFTRRKAEELLALVERHVGPPSAAEAVDVGCGIGLTDSFLAGRLASLTGVDVSPGVLERAAERNPAVRYELYDGERLPFADGSFDVAFTVCVVQVLPPEKQQGFVCELRRVVREGGLVVAFEHNPFNPLTRLAVRRFTLGHDAHMLSARRLAALFRGAGLAVVERAHILLVPAEGRAARAVERRLARLPLGAQYVLAGRPHGT